jgi:AraC family transcriptional regulator of adaptative response / DNA-3-methyladenine glycosylase II
MDADECHPVLLGADAGGGRSPGTISVRLPYRAPFDHVGLLAYLGARAVPGVEEVDGGTYRRTLRLPGGAGVAAVRAGKPVGPPSLEGTLWLEDLRDGTVAVERLRRLLDLDADPEAADAHLGRDPLLQPWVVAAPGRRSPGAVDGEELAVRAVLGQQISVAAARTLAGRLVARLGTPVPGAPHGSLTHLFPDMTTLATAREDDLPRMPASRRRTLRALAVAASEGGLDLKHGADRDEAEAALLALPGVGPWTAGYVRMRALGDPDVFLSTDLAVRTALRRLGVPAGPGPADTRAAAWAPWRAYAVHHLWASLGGRVPTRPPGGGTRRPRLNDR